MVKLVCFCAPVEITGGKGVDVAVEALGKPQPFSQCTQSVKDGGKAVIIGLVQAGAIGQVDINRLVRRKIKVIGSHGRIARQDLPKSVTLAETGIYNLSNTVSRRYYFEEAGKAFEDLKMGKIVGRACFTLHAMSCDKNSLLARKARNWWPENTCWILFAHILLY